MTVIKKASPADVLESHLWKSGKLSCDISEKLSCDISKTTLDKNQQKMLCVHLK